MMSLAAQRWSQHYTLEKFEDAIRGVLQPKKAIFIKSSSPLEEKLGSGMRVLQLIDTLRPGGAEQMAISYANALNNKIEGSFLCCTRMEGVLRKKISGKVGYLFLRRRSRIDIPAFLRLRKFIKENKIDLIQAHGSSVFLALMIKKTLPGIKLIWHDHWGERALKKASSGYLEPASFFFDGIISVNKDLQAWAEKNLHCKNVQYFPNFSPLQVSFESGVRLQEQNSFKVICVANLKPPKDHLNLLKAFKKVLEITDDISLHLVGKDEQNSYSECIKLFIRENNLEKKVFLYGEQENVLPFIKSADLGVLSSTSEGLPVSLLEYANAGLPVVCTSVGDCPEVIGTFGKLVPPENSDELASAIRYYWANDDERKWDSQGLQKRVKENFSEEKIITAIIAYFNKLVH